ncbi:MAG TPA: DUF4142 domain-containing protein [Tepidisphaeraceae bacterium]|jgi:putative membrane protein|nr:DUF4142 domain-containing protein [Tepidisphaeraceae bacterium]
MSRSIAVLAVMCLLAGCSSSDMSSDSTAGNGQSAVVLSITDRDFVHDAAIGGMYEVQAGQIAAAKATSADLRQFGQKMVADHTQVNNELQQLASQKGIAIPTELNSKHQEMIDQLNKLGGSEFEQDYINGQVKAHEKTIELFQKEARDGQDNDLKAFASRTLPTLQHHLDMIKGIQSTWSVK